MGALVISFAAITLEMVATTNSQWFGGEFLNGFAVGTFGTICITYVEEVSFSTLTVTEPR